MDYKERLYPGWDEELHRKATKHISETLFGMLESHKDFFPKIIYGGLDYTSRQTNYWLLTPTFNNMKLDWIENLHVYLSDGSGFDYDTDTREKREIIAKEPSSCVIDNTKVYGWDNVNDCLYSIDCPYHVVDITRKSTLPPIYMLNSAKDKILHGTIFVCIPPNHDWNVNKLSYVIQHELQHLRDMLDWNKNQEQLMKDVLMLNLSVRNNNRLIIQAKKFLNYRTPKNVRMNMLRPSNYSYELMSYIVGEVIEMLNLSEIAAYLHNFVGDLGNKRLPEIKHKNFPS